MTHQGLCIYLFLQECLLIISQSQFSQDLRQRFLLHTLRWTVGRILEATGMVSKPQGSFPSFLRGFAKWNKSKNPS